MSSEEGGGEKKGTPMMKLIIMAVVGLLLVGGGGFGVMWFMKKKAAAAAAAAAAKPGEGKEGAEGDPHAKETAKDAHGAAAHGEGDEDEDDAHAAGGGHGEGAAAPAVLEYRKIVNLEGPRKNSFLKVELHIVFRDEDLGKAATGDKPSPEKSEIQSILLELLSGRSLEEARDLEFRESLRTEIKDRLNQKFAPKPPKPGEKEDPKKKKPKKPVKSVLVVDWAIQE